MYIATWRLVELKRRNLLNSRKRYSFQHYVTRALM